LLTSSQQVKSATQTTSTAQSYSNTTSTPKTSPSPLPNKPTEEPSSPRSSEFVVPPTQPNRSANRQQILVKLTPRSIPNNSSSYSASKSASSRSEKTNQSQTADSPRNASQSSKSSSESSQRQSGSVSNPSRSQQYRHGVTVNSGLTKDVDRDPKDTLAQEEREKIDKAGVKRVMNYEREQGRNPSDMNEVSPNFPGYDIKSEDPDSDEIRYIEVKSLRNYWDRRGVKVTRNQFETGEEYQDDYWLYVVERSEVNDECEITTIQNPAGLVGEFYYDDSWRQLGDLAE